MKQNKIIEYKKEMGEIKDFDLIKSTLSGMSLEEQRKYFYSIWQASHFTESYTFLYENDRPVIVYEGFIVGILLYNKYPVLSGMDKTVINEKGISEHIGVRFTPIPLDATSCNDEEATKDPRFFETHRFIKK